MNIQRYFLPVTVAAAVHVALFLALPDGSWKPATTIIEIPLPPWPDKPQEMVAPPEDPLLSTEPVRALPSEPTLPVIDQPEVYKPDDLAMLFAPKPVNPTKGLKILPEITGIEGVGVPGGPRQGIYLREALDRVPNAKVQIPPDYPPAMSHSGTNGSATIELDVNTEGRVVRAEVVGCSQREFGEAAARAVLKWRFEPGRRNGIRVPFRLTQQIEFGIDPN